MNCATLGQCLNVSDAQLFYVPNETENSLLIGLWCGSDGMRMWSIKGRELTSAEKLYLKQSKLAKLQAGCKRRPKCD